MNSTYNITLKLGALLSLPSRFIARIRRFDDFLNQDIHLPIDDSDAAASLTAAGVTAATHAGTRIYSTRPPPARDTIPYEFVAMPGPLAFLTSGYAVGLVTMALLLNRIQHIVVPPRRSFVYRVMRSRRSLFHAFLYSFFPINLSSTACRLTLRIPSLFFLFKSLALLSVILLQASELYPATNITWIQSIGQWAAQKNMADVCWSTFGAVCLALIMGALTRGLEGLNTANTSPFNLFGYAMLLHIYSVPFTHVNKGPPSRPDKNVILTIILPLLQLTMIHFLGVKKRWAKYRLIPTTICSLITLIHFNYVLLTKPSSYPLLNYLPCLLETILLLVTLLTCGLNALTQLLLEGEIRRPLFGHARSLQPKWDEDFAVVLLRLGTASLEATNVAGLGNEVGSVALSDPLDAVIELQRKNKNSKTTTAADDGVVELASSGVLSVSAPKAKKGKGKRSGGGFLNEIKSVKVQSNETDWLVNHVWLRELVRFGLTLLAVARGLCRLAVWLVWYRWWQDRHEETPTTTDSSRAATPTREGDYMRERASVPPDDEDSIYSRFLRGESVSDDEDDDYVPSEGRDERDEKDSPYGSLDPSDIEDEPGTEAEDSEVAYGRETASLYSDLLKASDAPTAPPGPVLIAHMTASSPSPLTRRRYNQLVAEPRQHTPSIPGATGDPKDEWLAFLQDRRTRAPDNVSYDTPADPTAETPDGRRCCVICTTEPREIICWPCRCLALCDDCRENLASRFPASKHTCPCCRRNVEGFSRIFIP